MRLVSREPTYAGHKLVTCIFGEIMCTTPTTAEVRKITCPRNFPAEICGEKQHRLASCIRNPWRSSTTDPLPKPSSLPINTAEREGGGENNSPHHSRRRSEEHTSELQSLMRISYAVFC